MVHIVICDLSKEDCMDTEQIEKGFQITRDIEGLHAIFSDLVQEDGSVLKMRNDYDTRAGLTTKPIATNNVLSVQVLHALLQTFDHFMKIAVHLRAAVFDWSESPTSHHKQFLVNAKKDIQKKIQDEIGVQWDFPDPTGKGGTSTTGNTARNILHHSRQLVVEMVPAAYRQP